MFLSESILLCSPEYLVGVAKFFKFVKEQKIEINAQQDAEKAPVTPGAYQEGEDYHIHIYGPLVSVPDPYLVVYSQRYAVYEAIQNDIDQVYEHKGVKNVYLHINSPGGTVSGVDETWQKIRALSENYNVVAINEGLVASAAYWLASAANKIVAQSETNEQGSIGVIASYLDFSGMDEKMGIEERVFTSKNAKYKYFKNEGFDDRLQLLVDDLEDIFVARIAEGRGLTKQQIYNNFGQGATILSRKAKEVGMIDEIMSAEQTGTGEALRRMDAIKSRSGDNMERNLAELLADPGVQAEIEKAKVAGYAEGKEKALENIRAVMPYLNSDAYPQSVKDCALDVCEGKKPFVVLETLVEHADKIRAEYEQKRAQEDEANQQPITGEMPNFGVKERTVEERVKAVRKLEGKE